MLARLKAFLSAVPGSIRGIVSHEEQIRALLTALASGNVVAVLTAVLALAGVAAPWVPGLVAALAPLVAFAVDYLRRMNHDAPAKV